ncbi:hypothetical protein EBT31_23165, partial [bacterium]|nr:hypothetical protein [bacterium]
DLMAFLDYLLGGVSGGFEGYERKKAKDLEAKRYADEQERQRKSEARQLAMDIANLQSQGYEDAPEVRRKQQAALNTAGTLGVAALNSVLGGPPGALPSKANQELLMKGYATAKPERTIDYGGRQFALRETPEEREDRLARAKEMKALRDKETEEKRLTALAASAISGGPKSQAAVRFALENPTAYKAIFEDPNAMTAYQRAMLNKMGAQDKATAAAKKGDTGAQGTVIQEELDRLTAMMPVPKYGTGKDANKIVGFNKPTTDLSPKGVSFAQSDCKTGKVNEHVYQRRSAAENKVAQLMRTPDIEFTVCDHERIHHLTMKDSDD